MKKRKWALVLVFCIVCMLQMTVLADGEKAEEATSSITKIEWIHLLAEQFQSSDDFGEIEIHDVKEDEEYYADVVWAVGKGLVSLDENGNLNPNDTVSKGFSAYTLSLCLDVQIEDSMTEADVSSIPEDAAYYEYDCIAVSRGWFATDGGTFDDTAPVTKEEAGQMLEDADNILSMQNIAVDETASGDFQDEVIEVPMEKNVSIVDNGGDTQVILQDSDTEIEAGDTFIVYQDTLPIAYEAQQVDVEGGESVIQVSRASDDAYGDLNQQGVLQLNASNAEFIPSENVRVLSNTFATNSADLGSTNLEYKDGKIILSMSALEGGENVSVSISNLALKYSVNENGTMMALTGNWSILSEFVTKDDIINLFDKPLGEIRILGVGVIKLQFRFSMSLSMKISCSGTFTAGVSTLSDGTVRGIHEFSVDHNNSSIAIKGKIEFSLRISGGLDVLVMHGLVYGEIGLTTEASQEYHYVDDDGDGKTEQIECDDIQEYFTLKVGYDVKLFKTSVASDSVSPLGDNKNTPVLFRIHYENGVLVSKCRFGMTVEERDFGSKFTGGVDASEIDWSKRRLEVRVVLYEDLEVEGSLTIAENGGIDLNGYSLKIDGDLIQEAGVMNLNGGKLEVDGDYRIQKYDEKSKSYGASTGALRITGEKEEVTVGGDFYTQSTVGSYSNSGYNYFNAGKLTLKGNFTQLKGDTRNFQAGGTKVIFAGSKVQEISFETPESSYFSYPVFENKQISVKSGISNWHLNESIMIPDEGYPLQIVGNMDLNGYTLTINRSVVIKSGRYNVNGGSCKITGDLTQEAGVMDLNGGKLEVEGDYRIQKYDEKSKSYETSTGALRIAGEKEEVTVGGDFYTQSSEGSFSSSGCNYFSAGKLTLKGNFTQLKGFAGNFQAYGIKVVFAGSGAQEISFETPESSYFVYPIFKNSNVVFKSRMHGWTLSEDTKLFEEMDKIRIVSSMNMNGHVLTINGDLIQEAGVMELSGGTLEVEGDYRIQKYDEKSKSYETSTGALRIAGEKEEVTVGGDFYTQSSEGSFSSSGCNYFRAGKLTLKGNFTQLKGYAGNFQAGGTRVIFAGTTLQEVYFETPTTSYISNPVYQNTKVCYVGKRRLTMSGSNKVLTVSLPGNDNAVSEGLLFAQDSNPTLDTAGRTRIAFTESSNDEVTFDAAGLEGNTFRAYAIIKDVAGNDQIFYSEPVKIAG